MKKRLIFLLLLVLPKALFAQNEGKAFVDSLMQKQNGQELINSLVKKLSETKKDTNKIMLLDALTFFYANIDPDQGIKYGMQALELSNQSNNRNYLPNIYGSIGTDYFQKSEYPKGLEYFFMSLKLEEEKGNKNRIQIRLFNISSGYFNMGEYTKALEYANKALKLSEEMHDTISIASNLSNIGAIYSVQHNPSKAFEYLFRALKIFEDHRDTVEASGTMSHIGATYFDKKNYPEALKYAFKALKINEEIGSIDDMSLNLQDIGNSYLSMANDTVENLKKGPSPVNDAYLQKAIEYFKKGVALSKETGQLELLYSNDKHLSEAYELAGNYKEAMGSYKEYVIIKDSIYSNDNKVKLAKLETKREEQLKDKLIQINKLEQILFVVGLGLLLIVILVVVRNFMIQKKANKVQAELLAQKDILMKEIHHRVKNNLQVISTLLDLQLTSITDEQAKDAMTESTTRVRSISLIHQQLYQNENITSIEFSKFAKDLMQQVTTVFKKAGPPVILKSDMPETVLDIDTAVPLGLILNELMTNSYKYAFDNANDGNMEIVLQQKNGQYELRYKDNGPGLPAGLDVSKLKSLGIKVMRGLSKQIGGTFNYVAEDKTFVITFKDIAGRKLTD